MLHQSVRNTAVDIRCGSYQELSSYFSGIHLGFAIESFIHSPDLNETFSQLHTASDPRAQIVVFDDFLAGETGNAKDENLLEDFRFGWKANSLHTIESIGSIAGKHGFKLESAEDLTAMQDLYRPRDQLVALISPIARLLAPMSSYATFLVGGNARQQLYRRGLLTYQQLVFTKM